PDGASSAVIPSSKRTEVRTPSNCVPRPSLGEPRVIPLTVPDAVDPRAQPPLVIPRPKEADFRQETCRLSARSRILVFGPDEAGRAAAALQRELATRWRLSLPVELRARAGPATTIVLLPKARKLSVSPVSSDPWRANPEGYLLAADRQGAR